MTYIDVKRWDIPSIELLIRLLGEPTMGFDDFNKENVTDILSTLIDELHDMRRNGDTDMRSVISHVHLAKKAITDLKEPTK